MKTIRRCMLLALFGSLVFAIGCGEGGDPDSNGYTKEEAAALSGIQEDGRDICALEGWYGDGTCDGFCPKPDEDCETDSYEPCGDKVCGERCTVCPPDDPDCVETAVIKVCQGDGTCSASNPVCQGGDYEPCENKTCGEACTLCPPDDTDCVETAVVKYCNSNGVCAPTQPSCNGGDGSCSTDADCIETGCSGQVCASGPKVTTCEWKEEYACYDRFGDCGCVNGTCAWADDPDLTRCLGN